MLLPVPKKTKNDLAYATLAEYASAPGQVYPLNIRTPFTPQLDHALISVESSDELSFDKRHNLYQKVKNSIRLKQDLRLLSWNT